MNNKTRNRRQKLITIPLTSQDLTITAFFASQQLLTNLSNTQDPSLLQSDIAECLHTDIKSISHLPIGSWDDNLLRTILETSDSIIIKEETNQSQTDSDPSIADPNFTIPLVSNTIEEEPETNKANQTLETPELENLIPNTSITVDTTKAEISLLGIARHYSNLIVELGKTAKQILEGQKQTAKNNNKAERPKPNTIKAHKFNKRSEAKSKRNNKIKPISQSFPKTLDDLLPNCLWFIHKGTKYFLLGKDVDASLGRIPTNKLTVAEYTTMLELERQANAQSPKRDPKTNKVFVDTIVKAVNGNPTGETLSDETVRHVQYTEELRDIDIAFNLSIRQVAVLLRRADEILPVNISDREHFINERAQHFADAPAWIVFAIRGFFLERLMAYSLTPAVSHI